MKTDKIIKEEEVFGYSKGEVDHVCVRKLFFASGKIIFNKEYIPGKMYAHEYWAGRERDLLMLLNANKVKHVVKAASWQDYQKGVLLELETWDAGLTLDHWFQIPLRLSQNDKKEEYCPFTSVDEFLKLLRGCLLALQSIHKNGFVHCDIKANNISLPCSVDEDGKTRLEYNNTTLIDFGYSIVNNPAYLLQEIVPVDYALAEYYAPMHREALRRDAQYGKPEQYQKLDYSCDLFSLGKMGRMMFDVLEEQAGGVKPIGTQIRIADLETIMDRLEGFENGIPEKIKEQEPGLAHQDLIDTIDALLNRINPDADTSFPFIALKERVAGERQSVSPITTPVVNLKPGGRTPVLAGSTFDPDPAASVKQEIKELFSKVSTLSISTPGSYPELETLKEEIDKLVSQETPVEAAPTGHDSEVETLKREIDGLFATITPIIKPQVDGSDSEVETLKQEIHELFSKHTPIKSKEQPSDWTEWKDWLDDVPITESDDDAQETEHRRKKRHNRQSWFSRLNTRGYALLIALLLITGYSLFQYLKAPAPLPLTPEQHPIPIANKPVANIEPESVWTLYQEIQQSSFYQTGKGEKPTQWDSFLKLLAEQEKKGDHKAIALLSGLRQQGKGVPLDQAAALRGYFLIMNDDSADSQLHAQVSSAAAAMTRHAIEIHDSDTMQLLLPEIKKMADSDKPYWQMMMGEVYRLGVTGSPDLDEAAVWYQKAASRSSDDRIRQWAEQSLESL